MNSKITIEDLCISYGTTRVLMRVSCEIRAGETVCIIGRSGVGKSSFLRALNGSQKLLSGKIFLDGQCIVDTEPVFEPWEIARHLALVPQGNSLIPYRPVQANIEIPLRAVAGMDRVSARRQAQEIAAQLGLSGLLERYPRQLSGGQIQRVQLARVMALAPQVLLLDEITAGLDSATSREVWQTLQITQGRSKESQTIILATHDLALTEEIADRIFMIERQSLTELDAGADLSAI